MSAGVQRGTVRRGRSLRGSTRWSTAANAVSEAVSLHAASIPSSRRHAAESLIILFFRWRGHDGQLQGTNDAQGGHAAIRHLESRGPQVPQCGAAAVFLEDIAGESAAIRRRRQCDEGRYRGAAQLGTEGASEL